jgi:asparagine synthase (glutamine-hydrolysing)
MCGIAGKLFFDPEARIERASIQAMLTPMRHRGPDGQGIHLDGNAGLGHLRLSIIDLNTGAQPMTNEDETIWIVFNGEIYNFQELRGKLLAKGHVFRSQSDTEVIVHAYEEFGPDCVKELRGMFAFAIWDAKRRRLFVARDRVGIKPLYFCETGQAFYFASELKAIIADSAVPREINLPGIRKFLAFHYLPGTETLFKSIHKLPPGFFLTVEQGKVTQQQYWDLRFSRQRWQMPFDEATEELHSLLASTVRDHMIADVPVGILSSGGVDSSAILNFAVHATDKKIKTFTVGFDGSQVVDERPYARLSAERFGTEHFETSISADDFWNFLPSYVWHMEEPVCEPPAVALFYVSKLARNHVKVLLSGEGGDEAFAGYPNYPNMMRLDRIRAALGPLARTAGVAAALAGQICDNEKWQRYGSALGRPLATQYFSRTSGPTGFFNRNAESFFTPEFLTRTATASAAGFVGQLTATVNDEPLLNQMLYVDSKTWLPDDLLVKADKITMANSLELRVPLLDHIVLEFAASLPPNFKVRGHETKRILKATFARSLPEEILKRKKAGFPVPYESWLRGGLKQKVEDVLLSDRCLSRGYFQKAEVSRLLEANSLDNKFAKEVFCLLVLELWHREFMDPVSGEDNPASGVLINHGSRREKAHLKVENRKQKVENEKRMSVPLLFKTGVCSF